MLNALAAISGVSAGATLTILLVAWVIGVPWR
jgi:hypothetical protein